MLQVVSILIVQAICSPTPQDYSFAESMFRDDCPYNYISEIYSSIPYEPDYCYGMICDYQYQRTHAAFRQLCINRELADDNDYNYVFDDVADMRERLKYFYKYPNPNTYNFNIGLFEVKNNHQLSSDFRNLIHDRMKSGLEQDRIDGLRDIYKEAREYYKFWDSFYDIKRNDVAVPFFLRKLALISVIEDIGEENFYMGNYPQSHPFWLIQP